MVLATIEISQLHVDKVVDSLCAGRALLPCRDVEADPHGLVDHGDSPVLH